MAMIAITTKSSIRVKPLFDLKTDVLIFERFIRIQGVFVQTAATPEL